MVIFLFILQNEKTNYYINLHFMSFLIYKKNKFQFINYVQISNIYTNYRSIFKVSGLLASNLNKLLFFYN